jgi:hypothetical protein
MNTFEKRTRGYVAVPNSINDDDRLSFKALGILTYLLSRPDDWRPNYRQLMKTHTDGEVSVRAGLTELEEAGYYRRSRVQYPDGTWGWLTTVSETPSLGEPSLGNPGPDDPGSTNDGGTMTEEQREISDEISPRLPQIRKPNPIWDALEDAFGEPRTAPERSRRGKTVKELREVGASPEQVAYAVKRHRSLWPAMTVTERSIVAHWSELVHAKKQEAALPDAPIPEFYAKVLAQRAKTQTEEEL